MEYRSTRGGERVSPRTAILQGIASDGGLFVPAEWPEFPWEDCLSLDVVDTEAALLDALLPGCGSKETVRAAYRGKFDSEELTPLKKVGERWALELYYGPTSAFKDVALTLLPHLIGAVRQKDERVLILTATSGDTGKAALEGFRDVAGTEIVVFFPLEGVSEVQRLQMLTQEGANVRVCAVRGNFDDCQRGVKRSFARLSAAPAEGLRLSSANSINIGRLVPQIAYYFGAYASLCRQGVISVGDKVDFSVPTGNFGDILAGWYAKKLGLPVGTLVCASNANDVLTDFFRTGVYDDRRPFRHTTSPSMDILVSSNLERLLFDVCGDTETVCRWMRELDERGFYAPDEDTAGKLRAGFAACRCGDGGAAEVISRLWREEGYLCDPHTAVGFAAAEEYARDTKSAHPMVVLSTASPFKFSASVLAALGETAEGDEFEKMERLAALTGQRIPAGLASLREKSVLHRDEIGAEEIEAYVLALTGKES